MVHVYVQTTFSQKRLELQALRCNGETRASGHCQHRRHHGILRFQLDSDVCSADLHHNPRKHVGLHAHQRLHRLPEDGRSSRPRLRDPRVVVLACSPGSGAVRASSQSRAALLTRPPVSRISGMKLSWSAYFAALTAAEASAASPGVVPLPWY
jgi:hypothetical protein